MRVIDFRVRPPYGGFSDLILFRESARTERIARDIGFALAPSVRQRSMELLVAEMDAAGVRCGVITGRTGTVFGSVGNEVIEQVVAAYPGRFIGIAYIAPHDRKAAVAEIERAIGAGFKAVVLEPGLTASPMYLDDPRLYPIYAHLEDRRMPVVFMAGGNAGPDVTYSAPEHIDRVAAISPICRSCRRTATGHG